MNSINKKKDFIWNFLGVTFNTFTSFFFLIIVNRINGKDEAGIFTFAYSLVCLFYFIGVYYNRAYIVSDTKEKISNKEYIIHRVLTCALMIIFLIIYCIIFKYSQFKYLIIIFLGIYRMLEALSDSIYGVMQKKGYLYKTGIFLFIKALLSIVLFGIVDYVTKDLILATIILCSVNLVILLLFDIPNSIEFIKNNKASKDSIIKIFKKAFPIFIFSILNIYLVNASKYTLDVYGNSELQNIFGIILMPGTLLSLCGQYLINPFMVQMSESLNKNDTKNFKKIVNNICLIILAVGLIGEIVCLTFGIPLLNVLYHVDLDQYKIHLMIIILGAVFLALVSILSAALTLMKKNSIQMYIYIVNSILSLFISVLLIKNYLIIGATITYFISMLIQFILTYISYIIFLKKWRQNEK